jgi:hypothetical protein
MVELFFREKDERKIRHQNQKVMFSTHNMVASDTPKAAGFPQKQDQELG